jgi:glycosyltransferase involved in cell wall biosynthesis
MKIPVTVIIAVKNEEKNISKCLDSLAPASHIFVIDSSSTDKTIEIAKQKNAEVIQFKYKGGYPKKRQWTLENLPIENPWVLMLDADEIIPLKLWDEIGRAISSKKDAFLITKGFYFMGRRFRFGGFSHRAVLLFRKGKARFEHILDETPDAPDMEIHERLIVNGKIGALKTPLIHEDYKGLEAYIARHNLYSTWEAKVRHIFLAKGKWGIESVTGRFRGDDQQRRRFLKGVAARLPFESWLWFFFHYIFCLGFLEGRRGLIASQIRKNYIDQVRAKIFELNCGEHFVEGREDPSREMK